MKVIERIVSSPYSLRIVLIIAFIPRLLAAIFSKGYGMHDDHFLVIEAAQSWVDGYDYNAWLPWTPGNNGPSGHSLFYVGLHFILFKILHLLQITHPQTKMLIVRLLHALFSLSVIYYGYKISEKIGDKKLAVEVSLILGLLWFMPMLSVRNLVEVVCTPFLLAGTYQVMNNHDKSIKALVAGIITGVAFSVRFQTLFFIGGLGLALLLLNKIRLSFFFGLGVLLSIAVIQSVPDYFLWKRPFAEFTEYVSYNLQNATTYFNKPWHQYLWLISGILIPPVSLFLLWGFFSQYKKQLLLFLPTFCFLAFHCYFPNKQERFIFPAIPFIVILGYYGWNVFIHNSSWWKKHYSLYKSFWLFAIVVNFIALPVVSTAYSKRSRVEAMLFLRNKPPVKAIIVNDANHDRAILLPRFYLGQWKFPEHAITKQNTPQMLASYFERCPHAPFPNYVLFYEEENFEARFKEMKHYFPKLRYLTTIHPGFLDKVLHRLNKHNKNSVCYIYSLEK